MSINITQFRDLPIEELVREAQSLGIDNAGNFRPSELIFELVCRKVNRGDGIIGCGILEILSDGFGFLRSPVSEFGPGTDDIYVSPAQIRRFNLRTGDWVVGKARTPRDNERYLALLHIEEVNGASPEKERKRLHFNSMTIDQLTTDVQWKNPKWAEVFDQLEIQQGSRNLLIFDRFQSQINILFQLISAFQGESILALINSSPEDVSLIRRIWKGEVYASFKGESAQRHHQVSQIVSYRAKRLTEQGKDINLVFSTLNEIALMECSVAEQSDQSGGESVGIGAAQRILSLGRNFKNKGSLTFWGAIHRNRTSYEQEVCDRIFYEATSRIYCKPNLPANVDLEASLKVLGQH